MQALFSGLPGKPQHFPIPLKGAGRFIPIVYTVDAISTALTQSVEPQQHELSFIKLIRSLTSVQTYRLTILRLTAIRTLYT
jgi:hypothetical protein